MNVIAKQAKNLTFKKILSLQLAVQNKQMDIVKLLLDKGANIEACKENKNTPIFQAIHSRSLEMVKLLIERGADYKAKNIVSSTPLHHSTGTVFDI